MAPAGSHRGLGRRGIGALAVLLGLLAAWVVLNRRQAGEAETPAGASVLAVIPRDAFLVAVVDVEALRATPIGARFLGQGRDIAGLGQVVELCGSDPMDAVRELAVAVPAGPGDGFGFFAVGAFDATRLVACAEKIVAQRGGRPVRLSQGRFAILRDASLPADGAQLAVAEGGPVLLGDPGYVEASLSLAGGAVIDHDIHRALREQVAPGVVLVTMVFSDEQRRVLADELRAQGIAESPFRALAAAALGVRLDATALRLHAVLRCDPGPACGDIARIIGEQRDEEAARPAAVALGLSAVLRAMRIAPRGDAVHVELELPLEVALTLLERLAALRQLGRELPQPPASSSAPVVQPDTTASVSPDAGVKIEPPEPDR